MSSSEHKKLIIYDLDGTLVDTGEDIAQAVDYMLRQMNSDVLSKAEVRHMVGGGLHDLVGRCLNTDDPVRVQRGMELFGQFYGQHLCDHSALYPSVKETLDYFHARARQAIVTNKPSPFAEALMDRLGVGHYFSEILAGGSAYPKKPDPASVRAVMARGQIAPEDALLLGDSPIDVETGRRAGILTVIVTQGFADRHELEAAKPDLLIDDVSAFLALVKARGW